jgi:MSHA pilin protein MshD
MTRGPANLRPPAARPGMTLIEVMFATVIMATMLTAAFGAIGAAARTRLAQRESALGLALGRQLLSEILQTRYKDLVSPTFGTETGETRATYDDVDDYDGLSEGSAAYANGTVIAGGAGWKRKVKVDWVDPADPTSKVNTDQGLKRVVVTVTSPGGRVTTVTGLRTTADRYATVPASQVTYTSWVGVSIQVGTSATARNVQGVPLVNLVP